MSNCHQISLGLSKFNKIKPCTNVLVCLMFCFFPHWQTIQHWLLNLLIRLLQTSAVKKGVDWTWFWYSMHSLIGFQPVDPGLYNNWRWTDRRFWVDTVIFDCWSQKWGFRSASAFFYHFRNNCFSLLVLDSSHYVGSTRKEMISKVLIPVSNGIYT